MGVGIVGFGHVRVIPYATGGGSAWLKFDLGIFGELEDWVLTIL